MMTPSEAFIADAHASCETQMDARMISLRRLVNERVAGASPAIAGSALVACRDAIAAHAMRRLLEIVATFPDDFPEQSAMSVLDGIIGGLDDKILGGIADEAIHPAIDKLH